MSVRLVSNLHLLVWFCAVQAFAPNSFLCARQTSKPVCGDRELRPRAAAIMQSVCLFVSGLRCLSCSRSRSRLTAVQVISVDGAGLARHATELHAWPEQHKRYAFLPASVAAFVCLWIVLPILLAPATPAHRRASRRPKVSMGPSESCVWLHWQRRPGAPCKLVTAFVYFRVCVCLFFCPMGSLASCRCAFLPPALHSF